MQASKTKRVFQLRKTGPIRQPSAQEPRLQPESQDRAPTPLNLKQSALRQPSPIVANQSFKAESLPSPKPEVNIQSKPSLIVDQQELHYYQKIGNAQVKHIKVTNVGTSAIYYEWAFKNLPKINPNAIKDPKPRFYCHYHPNVIKPGQEEVFSFSFYSEIPGTFVEEISLVCQPELVTPIPPIRLKGIAYIQDQLKSKRNAFTQSLKQRVLQVFAKQVVEDLVKSVKNPEPPLPDVSNPEIAEKQFEAQNSNLRLYYNSQIHQWFNRLFNDICNHNGVVEQQRHWDQSVATLSRLIENVSDSVLRQSYDKRLQNYVLLSAAKPPQKSNIFPRIKEILMKTGYQLGGAVADQAKKQLQMWQIPFEQPSETQTEEEKAAKKDQRTKIIADWAKKMKKKKWGEEQEKQILNNYRAKLAKGVAKQLINQFDGFDNQAGFVDCAAKLQQKFQPKSYFSFLQRLKTTKQYPIEGKKILLRFDLKLKPNCQQQLTKLSEYLEKKKEQELKAEEQRKNQQINKAKKKAVPVKKKKGQKQQQQIKPVTFDFNSILDRESWQGLIETLRFIIEKQPYLLVIGITYGPKTGLFNQKYSVRFLLEVLKQVQPNIEFLEHKNLFELRTKIQEQTLNEGSIYMTENLSFLPCQGMQSSEVHATQHQQNGETIKKQTVSSRKLLMSQLSQYLEQLSPAMDIIVREDRLINRSNGICSFSKKPNILGLTWWKYIAMALRTHRANIVLGGHFTPEKVVMLGRLAMYCQRVWVVGELGAKLWMAASQRVEYCGIRNSSTEDSFLRNFIQEAKEKCIYDKIELPVDFLVQTEMEGATQTTSIESTSPAEQIPQGSILIDIGPLTIKSILLVKTGNLFFIGQPAIHSASLSSLEPICRSLAQSKQQKQLRHIQQQGTPAGVNYDKDLVVYFVGIDSEVVEQLELKEKVVRERSGEEEEEPEEEQEESEVKKIDRVTDFYLGDTDSFENLLAGNFSYILKDIDRYSKSD